MDSADLAPSGREGLFFGHEISLRSFLGLSLKNGLLNLVTLTLYRFWARTEVRRRLWSKISINNERLEYTGRGMELFIGFLIAVGCVIVPFLMLVFLAQFLGPIAMVIIIPPLYLAMFMLLGAAQFMAFRYVASRTTWRGVRFRLTGKARDYGWAFLGYTLLTGVTLGWFAPAQSMRLAGRMWGGLCFGDRKLSWARSGDNLYGPYALGWVCGVVGYVAWMIVVGTQIKVDQPPSLESFAMIYGALFCLMFFMMLVLAPYHAAVLRAVARSIRIDDVGFDLKLKSWELAWLWLSNAAMLLLSLGFLTPVIEARTARFLISRLSATGEIDLGAVQQVGRGPRTGEGLADALGVIVV